MSFRGLDNTLYPIFEPSYMIGMGPQKSPIDPKKKLGLHDHQQA